MNRNRPTLSGKTIRYKQSRIEQFTSTCKWCSKPVQDGMDDCLMCDDGHDTLPTVTIQFVEAVKWQSEQINNETDEYWRATR